MEFKKATKTQSRLRLSIAGPAGSGKTFTALRVAAAMGARVAVIDTERGSASKYADRFNFDVIELDGDYHPQRYIQAMRAAEKAGYDVLVIDSTTHEWNGKNGILELHEAAVARQKTKNSYTAWAEVTPLHNQFIDAILQSKCHIIATVRSKTEYVQEKNDRGYTEIRKVGMASIQRDGMDYEYDITLDMDVAHNGVIGKTRCAELDGRSFPFPGEELAEILKAWLSDGAPAVEKSAAVASDSPQVQPEPAANLPAPKVKSAAQVEFEAILPRLKKYDVTREMVAAQIAELCNGQTDYALLDENDFAGMIPEFEKWENKLHAAKTEAAAA